MSAATAKPHLWRARGVWWCAIVRRNPAGRVWYIDGLPSVLLEEPLGTGATPGEAGTVWRLVKHGQRFRSVP